MKVESFTLGPLATNAYLVTNEKTNTSVVIDPGMDPDSLLQAMRNTKVQAILLTHAHFDHIGGLEAVREASGAPVYIHPEERDWLADGSLNGSSMWFERPIVCREADGWLQDGETLSVEGFPFKVLHTPGHSPGGVSFLLDDRLFSGDALFAGSIGRTDLPGGDHEQLIASIQDRLLTLPDDVRVYPGHGPETTIGQEKDFNPFVTGILR